MFVPRTRSLRLTAHIDRTRELWAVCVPRPSILQSMSCYLRFYGGAMGLLDWIRSLVGSRAESEDSGGAAETCAAVPPTSSDASRGEASSLDASWVDVPPFVDVEDVRERTLVSVIASAVAAGERQDSKLVVRRVGRENPEYRRVAVISAAIAAADRPDSSFRCVRIRRRRTAESA